MEKVLKDAALEYVARGWRVFPCHWMTGGRCSCGKDQCSAGKHPLTANGFKDATTDPGQIAAWWTRWPDANIGIATGPGSGMFVLDLDGPDAIATVEKLEAEHGMLPETVTTRTGKGQHRYFQWNPERPIGNKVRVGGVPIDTRGDVGYVIAPPSVHQSGTRYEWVRPPDQVEMAPAPSWLTDFLTGPKSTVTRPVAGFALDGEDIHLRTAPGVEEGGRRDAATRLIGAHLGRGDDPFQVLHLAYQWADRCSPPFERDEVFGIVKDFAARDTAKLDEAILTTDRKPQWPQLGDEALYGLAGEIIRTIGPETEADPVAVLIQFLALFGNEVGRGPHALVGSTKHYANLYAVIAGESAKARKGTSGDVTRELFGEAVVKRIVSGLSSGEGVIARVTDAVYRKEPIRGKDKLVAGYQNILDTPAAEDKRLVVMETEFGGMLQVMRRDGNTLSPVVRNAWDHGSLSVMTKVPRRATGAHITIVGHVTIPELKSLLLGTDCFNGFANRFLWVGAKRSRSLPEGGRPAVSVFGPRVQAAVAVASKFGTVTRDDAAKKLWAELYHGELAREYHGIIGAVTARAEAQVLRLSLNYALLDGSPVIREEHIRAAMAVWRYCLASTRVIFGDTTGDELADKLLAAIRAKSRTTTELYKVLNNHGSKGRIEAAMKRLVGNGLVESERVETGGRPGRRWRAAA